MSKQRLTSNQRHWACRRGMLELDILLGNFLELGYPLLSDKESQLFDELLAYPDQTLFDYFLGDKEPDDQVIGQLIEKIRGTAAA